MVLTAWEHVAGKERGNGASKGQALSCVKSADLLQKGELGTKRCRWDPAGEVLGMGAQGGRRALQVALDIGHE